MTKTLPCGRTAPKAQEKLKPAKLQEWNERLRHFLSSQGLKYSEQRWNIAETILKTGGHLDAQTLVGKVRQSHPKIGPATVYRSLKVLCEAKILKESLSDAHGRVIYELFEDDHHDHIVCVDCGQIFEFQSDRIETVQREIVEGMSFREARHRHVVYAHCLLNK